MRQAGSLSPSTPRSPVAWAWDSRSAVQSFRITGAGCGLPPITAQAQACTLRFPSATKNYRMQELQESDALIAIVDDVGQNSSMSLITRTLVMLTIALRNLASASRQRRTHALYN